MTRKEVRAPLIGHLADLLAIAEPHRDHHLQHIENVHMLNQKYDEYYICLSTQNFANTLRE